MTRRLSTRTQWLLGLGLLIGFLFGPGAIELIRLSVMQHRLDRQLTRLDAEHARLTLEQDRLQNDPTYVEGLIRSTFNWAREGEFVILPETPASRDTAR